MTITPCCALSPTNTPAAAALEANRLHQPDALWCGARNAQPLPTSGMLPLSRQLILPVPDGRGDKVHAHRLETKKLKRMGKVNGSMKKLIAIGLAVFIVPAFAVRAADAKETYAKDCAKCHGKDGKGETKMGQKLGAKDYTDAKVQAELKDDAGMKAIKDGLKDKDGKILMKPAEGMSDADAKALVTYMRTFKT
jgi:cytochrome c1